MKPRIAVVLVLLLSTLAARSAEPCETPEQRQFDFWLGDWEISQRIADPKGQWIELGARTAVSRAAGGCALVERWTGEVQFPWAGMTEPEAMDGFSVRYFHPEERVWYIHWLDSRNPAFGNPFKGEFQDGVGRFFLTRETDQGPRESRISFARPAPDRVQWELAIEQEPGVWTTMWAMDMRRATE